MLVSTEVTEMVTLEATWSRRLGKTMWVRICSRFFPSTSRSTSSCKVLRLLCAESTTSWPMEDRTEWGLQLVAIKATQGGKPRKKWRYMRSKCGWIRFLQHVQVSYRPQILVSKTSFKANQEAQSTNHRTWKTELQCWLRTIANSKTAKWCLRTAPTLAAKTCSPIRTAAWKQCTKNQSTKPLSLPKASFDDAPPTIIGRKSTEILMNEKSFAPICGW